MGDAPTSSLQSATTGGRSIYEPLDIHGLQDTIATRIATILPELSGEGRIQCLLVPFFIPKTDGQEPSEPYPALSYVWGPEAPVRTIEVNRIPFEVRLNLWTALERIRSKIEIPFFIWIDALCINQAQISERNHQVKFMGSIYSKASVVIIWLGPNSEAHDAFWDITHHISLKCDEHRLDSLADFEPVFEATLQDHRWTRKRWLCALYEVLKLDYWRRAWVTQEMRLARRLVLLRGTALTVDPILLVLADAWCTLEEMDATGPLWEDPHLSSTFGRIIMIRAREKYDASHLLKDRLPSDWANRWSIFIWAAVCDCTDLRDRVYSQLSLIKGGLSFPIDYNEDALTLFVRTVIFCFEQAAADLHMFSSMRSLEHGLELHLNHVDWWGEVYQWVGKGGKHEDLWRQLQSRTLSYEIPAFDWSESYPTCPSCQIVIRLTASPPGQWQFCCISAQVGAMSEKCHLFFPVGERIHTDSQASHSVICTLQSSEHITAEWDVVQPLPAREGSCLRFSLLTVMGILGSRTTARLRAEKICTDDKNWQGREHFLQKLDAHDVQYNNGLVRINFRRAIGTFMLNIFAFMKERA